MRWGSALYLGGYVDTFEPHDEIVAPSGSCVGSSSHQHAMVARRLGDEQLRVEGVHGARTPEVILVGQ